MKNFIKQKMEILASSRLASLLLTSFIVAAALLYVYFANVAVRTLASLEKAQDELQTMNIEVSEMESKRLALENGVNAKLAAQLGFIEASHPMFIMKGSGNTALSFRGN